jgi:acetyl-CoA carboxylase carboxyl transferase subunit alpha
MSIAAPLSFENDIHALEQTIARLEADPALSAGEEVKRIRRELAALKKQKYSALTPWETVQVSRHPNRPQTIDYIEMVFEDFVELHGDRAFGDDRALRTGFARLGDTKVMLVGHQKGKTLKERQACFYGCAHPEGYRKALSKMRLAAKFGLPIICLRTRPSPTHRHQYSGNVPHCHADHLRRYRRRRFRRGVGYRRR